MKKSHSFRNKTMPLLSTVSPVTIWLILLVAAPLFYVFYLSFQSTDGYNVVHKLTLLNYKELL